MYLYSVNIESIHQSTFWTFISHTTISSRFTVSEMKRIYRGFKTECPTGLITEEAFQGIYSRFFPHGGTVHFHSIVSTLYKSNVKFLTPVLPAKMRIFFCGFLILEFLIPHKNTLNFCAKTVKTTFKNLSFQLAGVGLFWPQTKRAEMSFAQCMFAWSSWKRI